ncbi:hypothetical protein CR513_10980, partial [Mucuna pruriens]
MAWKEFLEKVIPISGGTGLGYNQRYPRSTPLQGVVIPLRGELYQPHGYRSIPSQKGLGENPIMAVLANTYYTLNHLASGKKETSGAALCYDTYG